MIKQKKKRIENQITARYSKKAIADALNNAVIMTGNPHSHNAPLTEENGRRLQAVTIDMLAPYMDYLGEGIVTPEEIVFALTAAALFVQMNKVLGDDKLPAGVEVKKFINLQKKAKIPPMETKCPNCKEVIIIS